MSCSKSLSQIFPEVNDSINIKLQSDFVRSLLQAAPSVFVFILSVLFCFIKRVKKHQSKNFFILLQLLLLPAITLNVYHFLDIIKCNDINDLESYRYAFVVGIPIGLLIILVLTRYGWGRVSSLIVSIISAGYVVAQHFFNKRLLSNISGTSDVLSCSQLFFNAQVFTSTFALSCLLYFDNIVNIEDNYDETSVINLSVLDPTFKSPAERRGGAPTSRTVWDR